ncbi:MAG: hypothetical protein ACPG7F_21315, partial [Aggregatilineales bacterium]
MQNFFIFILAILWLSGTILRIYRQARFYQIDEYKSNRYLRWLIIDRERWLPRRPTLAIFFG